MKNLPHITRRRFIGLSLFAAAVVWPRARDWAVARDDGPAADPLYARLSDFFHDKKSARAVGLEYLRMVPAERDARKLAELICPSRHGKLDHADRSKIKDLVLRQQREDFDTGRVVNVRGWILSRTEARLCALAAMD